MTPRDIKNIQTTRTSCTDTLSGVTWQQTYNIFTCLWRSSWLQIPSSLSLLLVDTVEPNWGWVWICLNLSLSQVWDERKNNMLKGSKHIQTDREEQNVCSNSLKVYISFQRGFLSFLKGTLYSRDTEHENISMKVNCWYSLNDGI